MRREGAFREPAKLETSSVSDGGAAFSKASSISRPPSTKNLAETNENPKPFTWTADGDAIVQRSGAGNVDRGTPQEQTATGHLRGRENFERGRVEPRLPSILAADVGDAQKRPSSQLFVQQLC
jgi:hypothetical protein